MLIFHTYIFHTVYFAYYKHLHFYDHYNYEYIYYEVQFFDITFVQLVDGICICALSTSQKRMMTQNIYGMISKMVELYLSCTETNNVPSLNMPAMSRQSRRDAERIWHQQFAPYMCGIICIMCVFTYEAGTIRIGLFACTQHVQYIYADRTSQIRSK